jgi:ribosomal protein L11 methyltransferase
MRAFFMSIYIKIEIAVSSKEQAEILIAELSEINFYAFEENESSLYAFIKKEFFNDEELNKILSANKFSYTKTVIEETNWNAKWETEFQPVIVDDFVAVRANFHPPINSVQHEIIITPKMSFGTGHHATTYLMLQQMQEIRFTGKSVLDFGTGTGVLAIMAIKSGALNVIAIDNDEWSINNAKENIAVNNCRDIELLFKDNLKHLQQFDIILANINLNVIGNNIDVLKTITNQSSILLLCGFLKSDEEVITQKCITAGFKHIFTSQKNEWIVMRFMKS